MGPRDELYLDNILLIFYKFYHKRTYLLFSFGDLVQNHISIVNEMVCTTLMHKKTLLAISIEPFW